MSSPVSSSSAADDDDAAPETPSSTSSWRRGGGRYDDDDDDDEDDDDGSAPPHPCGWPWVRGRSRDDDAALRALLTRPSMVLTGGIGKLSAMAVHSVTPLVR